MREIRQNNSMYTLNQDDIQMYLKDLRKKVILGLL